MDHTDNPTASEFTTALKWVAFLIVVGLIGFIGLHLAGVIGTVASAPGRVINKTLGTDNIISNYEWFYDVNAQYEARLGQIHSHATLVKDEGDAKERSRLNIELSAMRQSCRDMATKYNANSEKANRSIFKSRGLPETLPINSCEA